MTKETRAIILCLLITGVTTGLIGVLVEYSINEIQIGKKDLAILVAQIHLKGKWDTWGVSYVLWVRAITITITITT